MHSFYRIHYYIECNVWTVPSKEVGWIGYFETFEGANKRRKELIKDPKYKKAVISIVKMYMDD